MPVASAAVLKIYDTAQRGIVEFVPRNEGAVSMYVCGVTPYDIAHLGHGRTAVVFDIMRRHLAVSGYAVTFVTNVTDIEDKIIARAADKGTTESELAQVFQDEYWQQMDRLGVQRPDELPRATEFVPQMQALIAELIAAGRAYVIEGSGVYFAVEALAEYGKLSHRSLAQLLESAGSRVAVDDDKRSPVDFALWKAAKPGEPQWDSPWGPGRPGWHIECSAMALEILGEGFDLHGGGDDLVFPHHENEIAQAEGAGHPFARYWLHSAMVMVGSEKMSKSAGNFPSLASAIDAHGAATFRWVVARTHYRRQMEITDDSLRAAGAEIEGFNALARRAHRAGIIVDASPDISAFLSVMNNDFDTPNAVAIVHGWRNAGNSALDEGRSADAGIALAQMRAALDVLGIAVDDGSRDEGDAEIDALVAARTVARGERNFAESDRIRDELAERGITLEDTADGTVWRRS